MAPPDQTIDRPDCARAAPRRHRVRRSRDGDSCSSAWCRALPRTRGCTTSPRPQAVPNVAVVAPRAVENSAGLDLPGRLEAFIRAPIYARVPGYLKSWKHDIGSKVKAGELLAEIETPDLDQQLLQARADLNVARPMPSSRRSPPSAGSRSPAPMPSPSRTSTSATSPGTPTSRRSRPRRPMSIAWLAETGFKRLIAPFDGVVTARETDIGQLINVGATGGAELFVVSETQKLRVYVNVPQNYVPSVPAGTKATISRCRSIRQDLYRHGRSVCTVRQSAQRHDADADHRRQHRRRIDAGRLCQHPPGGSGRGERARACRPAP